PQDALKIEEREAEAYDETKVMDYIVKGGPNVIKAHLEHLRDHEEFEYLKEAFIYLETKGIHNPIKDSKAVAPKHHQGCAGSATRVIEKNNNEIEEPGKRQSQLTQWPIQLHLVPPTAPYYRNSDLLLAADCVAFSYGDFHKDFMKDKSLAIACPKLDINKEVYVEKITSMIADANVKSITVVIMQVPCCGGLLQIAKQAVADSGKDIPIEAIVIGINGDILQKAKLN
ncbi:MAG: 4Fe-4S ferredoxin, partial [Ignavibacteria bacterium GWB2_35_6b]